MTGLTLEQLEFLAAKGLTLEDVVELAKLSECEAGGANARRQARYRARLDVTATEWEVLRLQVFARDGYTCTYCASKDDLVCDHVIPLVQGGKSTLDNLTTACRPCNGGKSGRAPDEWLGDGN